MGRNTNISEVADALENALAGLQDAENRCIGSGSGSGPLNHVFRYGEAGGIAAAAGLFGIKALALCDDISDAWEDNDIELLPHIIEELKARTDVGAATNPDPPAATSLTVLATSLAEAVIARNAGDLERFALMSGLASGLMHANPNPWWAMSGAEMVDAVIAYYRFYAYRGELEATGVDDLVNGVLSDRLEAVVGIRRDQPVSTRDAVIAAYEADFVELTEYLRSRITNGARISDPLASISDPAAAERLYEEEVRTLRWVQNFGLRKARAHRQYAATPNFMGIHMAARELAAQERAGIAPGHVDDQGREADPPAPIEMSYWVVPGRLLAGEYPRNLDTPSSIEKLARLTDAGVSAFIDLTEDGEPLKPYAYLLNGPSHERFGIKDQSVPVTDELTKQALDAIDRHLEAGETVYVHCWGGVGRTGTIIGCWLSRHHEPGQAALVKLKELWKQNPKRHRRPRSPENDLQDDYILTWGDKEKPIAEHYEGCLVGLAVGDAVGTTLEFKTPGTFEPLDDMVGGGPYRLQPGQWTDDTSMALCLAESLVACEGFNAGHQMDLYVRWWREGYLSSTGRCFDIGNTVKDALKRYQQTEFAMMGSTDPMSAGNGSLMRLAPVAMFFATDPELAIRLCGESSRTTHGARTCIDACRYFGGLIVGALRGATKEELLSERYCPVVGLWERAPLCAEIDEIATGSFKRLEPPDIVGSGYVVKSLEAALWAFYRSETFEEGCLKAANLGNDADTTAAIYGQIAGAFYGMDGIPSGWREKLADRELISNFASSLHSKERERIT